MTECILMLAAFYCFYVASNVNSNLKKANMIRGIFVFLSFVLFLISIILCCVNM